VSAIYTHRIDIARRVFLHVEFVTDRRTVTVYDGAHGENELHRYGKQAGKMPAEVFHRGTLGEGMRAAIQDAKRGYLEMIESWNKR
jgi:hypothetical protein